MTSNFQECEICRETYDTGDHKPIVVLCGHSFCRSCLLAIERQGNMKCPKCRQPVTLPVDKLPVNYAIIPSEENVAANASTSHAEMFERCQNHGLNLDHFCASCDVLICEECVVKSHRQHQSHKLAEANLQELELNKSPATSTLRASSVVAEEGDLLTSDSHWRISTYNDAVRALSSAGAGRKASSLKIVSSATELIQMLPEVLNALCTACLGEIQIRDMNSFWGAKHESLHSVIVQHSRNITEFYGSFNDASALVRTKGKSAVKLGVGITYSNEIRQIQDWDVKPSSLSFNGALTPEMISKQPHTLTVRCLHFPDLNEVGHNLVILLLKEYFGKQPWFGKCLYLPRCGLIKGAMLDLLNNCEGFLKIFCQHTSLSAKAREELISLAQEKNIKLYWDINETNI